MADLTTKQIARTLRKRLGAVSEIVLTENNEIAVVLDDMMRFLFIGGDRFPLGYSKRVSEFSRKFSEYFGDKIPISLYFQSDWFNSGKPEVEILHSIYPADEREEERTRYFAKEASPSERPRSFDLIFQH